MANYLKGLLMISERLFARSYASFWRDLLPFSEAFVRGLNSNWDKLERPTSEQPEPLERAVINEAAVRLFRLHTEGAAIDKEAACRAIQEAAAWLDCPEMEVGPFGVFEVSIMASELSHRFGNVNIVFAPPFRGCGILSSCQADFIVGEVLVEVKSGYRSFRSADLRQVLVYLALNYLDLKYMLGRACLYNARLNRGLDIGIDDLCRQLAGNASSDIFSRIADFVTSGVASGV
jgi:hypothetical protein